MGFLKLLRGCDSAQGGLSRTVVFFYNCIHSKSKIVFFIVCPGPCASVSLQIMRQECEIMQPREDDALGSENDLLGRMHPLGLAVDLSATLV